MEYKKLLLLIINIIFILFFLLNYLYLEGEITECHLQCALYKNETIQLKIELQEENLKYKNAYNKAWNDIKKTQQNMNKTLYAKV